MALDFVSIDVETANADMASICQIGIARYSGGLLASEWERLVDPEDYFDYSNVSIHGIDENTVEGSPTFSQVASELLSQLNGQVVVCHTHFDRTAVHQACDRYGISIPRTTWLDSARVARRTWSDCSKKGYGLARLCKKLEYQFKHHNALEDAKAAAHVLIAACSETGLDIDGWIERVRCPINPSATSTSAMRREGNVEGALHGEVMAFTGALEIPRREAADMAAHAGCHVVAGVTKKTTILVVGDQDVRKLAGQEKSSKHRKAEEMFRAGFPIRILRESDFRRLIELEAS